MKSPAGADIKCAVDADDLEVRPGGQPEKKALDQALLVALTWARFHPLQRPAVFRLVTDWDALRVLMKRDCSVEATMGWLAKHREWRGKHTPYQSLVYSAHPGVRLQVASGVARFMGLNKEVRHAVML